MRMYSALNFSATIIIIIIILSLNKSNKICYGALFVHNKYTVNALQQPSKY